MVQRGLSCRCELGLSSMSLGMEIELHVACQARRERGKATRSWRGWIDRGQLR